MMVSKTGAPTAPFTKWSQIPWGKVEEGVERLQARIAKATKAERWNKVKVLQRLLRNSYYAKLLAVKRVTENKGGRTPGIDGIQWNTSDEKLESVGALGKRNYRAKPLRRVYINKKDNSKRPLGIPTLMDRATQALYLLGLEPIAESTADCHSYGFRKHRCCMDAIEQCFRVLARKTSAQWVLEADIKSCFDAISHTWIETHIPMDKKVLYQWLKSGVVYQKEWIPTVAGVPQGGIASPVITNMVLDGLSETLRKVCSQKDKVHLVRYADDFVVTAESRAILEEKVKPTIEIFLKERGLTLSPQKTKITHINDGFDFLGFNLRKYSGKLLIKPNKSNIKALLSKVGGIIKKHSSSTISLLRILNPILRGWAYYFQHVVSKEIFGYIDHKVFQMLYKWCRRRHRSKSAKWIKRKYFDSPKSPHLLWKFHAIFTKKNGEKRVMELFTMAYVPIRRFVKVRTSANPFLDKDYFEKRKTRKVRKS